MIEKKEKEKKISLRGKKLRRASRKRNVRDFPAISKCREKRVKKERKKVRKVGRREGKKEGRRKEE